jgi:hypothetical protein
VILVVVAIAAALLLGARGRSSDLPERVVVAATNRLPAYRRAWGQALVAELAAVRSRGQRWRFAAGVLWIALFPPAPRPATVRATVAVGAVATVAVTAAAVWLVPTLSVFVAVLGLLASGFVAAAAGRRLLLPTSLAHLAACTMAIAGILGSVGAIIAVATAHPAATQDRTHIFSVVLAVTLSGYLIAGLTATVPDDAPRAARWGGVVGASAAVILSPVLLPIGGVIPLLPPVTALATFVTAALVAFRTRSRAAAARAGLLVAILSAPVHFAMTVTAQLYGRSWTLTNPYDIAAYPHSGYPDVASYLLSDTLEGNIISLVVTPLLMYVLAAAGAALAPGTGEPKRRLR